MAHLEGLTVGTTVRGVDPDAGVAVASVHGFGSDALGLTFNDPNERVANQLVFGIRL
jgi:hypothetical protein